ncbi:lytic murein transglycosylase [Thiomicrorhabdus xiamenensis]|uniref:Lytic murein transglycosylase n=1 Tax=Thiomicrorhabdus xiamenensis TaxID=2739063 RepID=A0A7D4NQ66_9GAMM|nr:lytic murein transglycosylase [Thiomicrorhabdus xiamenensis]QKI88572.1 lytic murein transglycosylase [Thiomicrorhabdus xiamenensis]
MFKPNRLCLKSGARRLALTVLSGALFLNTASAEEIAFSNQDQQQFQEWINTFKQQALSQGISRQTLDMAFTDLTLSDKVLQSDRRQPEFTRTFFEYLQRAVSAARIENGKFNYQQQAELLTQVEAKYGVPGAYLVSFWGMETNYGAYTGYDPIIQSLATLAFDPRRSRFFSKELIAALKILDQGHVTLDDMKGSWAGAMGQVQFMPSNYLKYAVDGDGDGKINLWKSIPDALYSAGNFLNQLGWQAQQEWGEEVKLPEGFDYSLADGKTRRPIQDWQAMGVRTIKGTDLSTKIDSAILVLPGDYRGPAFLAYDNYKVIKRWNNSTNYAIGVGYLADQIRNKPKLSKSRPKDDKGLSYEEITEIQNLLNQLGFNVGKADGIAGSNTRSALRDFQKSIEVPADGYPSLRMLKYLRHAINNA